MFRNKKIKILKKLRRNGQICKFLQAIEISYKKAKSEKIDICKKKGEKKKIC